MKKFYETEHYVFVHAWIPLKANRYEFDYLKYNSINSLIFEGTTLEIVSSLESGTVSLDDSLKLFEEGIKLSKILENKLKGIEEKAVKVIKKTENSVV